MTLTLAPQAWLTAALPACGLDLRLVLPYVPQEGLEPPRPKTPGLKAGATSISPLRLTRSMCSSSCSADTGIWF